MIVEFSSDHNRLRSGVGSRLLVHHDERVDRRGITVPDGRCCGSPLGGATQRVRIFRNEFIPIDPHGAPGPAVSTDYRFLQVTISQIVYVYDRRGGLRTGSQSSPGPKLQRRLLLSLQPQ